ncbi:MAG: hypothetical protein QM754_18815 [Tepidisphaeraceae bacterium]
MHDLITVLVLIVLEGTLSVDNALVLGLMAKRLPHDRRSKALTYGLVGAFVFRVAAIGFAAWLLHYPVVKLLGGGYLLYVAIKHFVSRDDAKKEIKLDEKGQPILDEQEHAAPDAPHLPISADSAAGRALNAITPGHHDFASFWPTVVAIELTDVAFAVDSILAALAFIPPHEDPNTNNPKLWVVMLGGFIGVILMRVAAVIFIRLLEKFPRFETSAYLLVIVIGLKLVVDWVGDHFYGDKNNPINFHSPTNVAFWAFWIAMVVCFCIGFVRGKKQGLKPA